MASRPLPSDYAQPRHHRRASSGSNKRVIEEPPIATQIIYMTTPPKRPKILKHAHTFPPDKKSGLRPKTPASQKSPEGKGSRRRGLIKTSAEAPTVSPSRKRAATSSLSSDEAKDEASGERVIKKARLGPTPMSPPDTPDKTVNSNSVSIVDARTLARGIATSETRLPMSPPTSPPLPLISDSSPKMDPTQRSAGSSAVPQVSGS